MGFLEQIRKIDTPEKRLDFLKTRRFQTQITPLKNGYSAQISELSILETADSVNDAYQKAHKKIDLALWQIANYEGEDHIAYMQSPLLSPSEIKRTLLFAGKGLILGLIIIVSVSIGMGGPINKLAQKADRFEQKLDESLNPNPQKKQERLERFKGSLEKMRPYLQEGKRFWESL